MKKELKIPRGEDVGTSLSREKGEGTTRNRLSTSAGDRKGLGPRGQNLKTPWGRG